MISTGMTNIAGARYWYGKVWKGILSKGRKFTFGIEFSKLSTINRVFSKMTPDSQTFLNYLVMVRNVK